MAIEKKTRHIAVCDGCSLRAPVIPVIWKSSSTVSEVWYEDLTELMNNLMREGWLFDWDQCWCPKCKEVPE